MEFCHLNFNVMPSLFLYNAPLIIPVKLKVFLLCLPFSLMLSSMYPMGCVCFDRHLWKYKVPQLSNIYLFCFQHLTIAIAISLDLLIRFVTSDSVHMFYSTFKLTKKGHQNKH